MIQLYNTRHQQSLNWMITIWKISQKSYKIDTDNDDDARGKSNVIDACDDDDSHYSDDGDPIVMLIPFQCVYITSHNLSKLKEDVIFMACFLSLNKISIQTIA